MWELQMKTGPQSGGWTWLNFNMSRGSHRIPRTSAPRSRRSRWVRLPTRMRRHQKFRTTSRRCAVIFRQGHGNVSSLNKLMGLWASAHLPESLTREQRQSTIDAAFALQQPDGGWSTTSPSAPSNAWTTRRVIHTQTVTPPRWRHSRSRVQVWPRTIHTSRRD